jgi:hypothetical protein
VGASLAMLAVVATIITYALILPAIYLCRDRDRRR